MSNEYSHDHLKLAVGKILLAIGWHSTNSTSLEILTDVVSQYLTQIAKTTAEYANEFGCVDPNVDHVGLAFRDFQINLQDLKEYVTYFNFGPPPAQVPKYPVPKENSLNFLKPGSKEVVTRPVHIPEHLPPMFPLLEAAAPEADPTVITEEADGAQPEEPFKKPTDVAPRPRLLVEEEGGRPTREISSVIMTTSGFLSPAREGKLPESRTPLVAIETPPLPPPITPPVAVESKPPKVVKKVEKKKVQQVKVKRTLPPKGDGKAKVVKPPGVSGLNKILAAAVQKTERFNTTITPVPMKMDDNVDKLFSEPDKKKINILKKISNVKNDKPENKVKVKEIASRENSPVLIIDEPVDTQPKIPHINDDITVELIDMPPAEVIPVDKTKKIYSDDDSPPGTPSTPKTPETLPQSPPIIKEKRKRKEKPKTKKIPRISSPFREEPAEMKLDKPKTPEAPKPELPLPLLPTMPYLLPNFMSPGLIPPLNNPLYSHLKFPIFGQRPPFIHPNLPINLMAGKQDTPPPKMDVAPEEEPVVSTSEDVSEVKPEKKMKKDKKDKLKKKNKKSKAEKKKLKEEKEKMKKEKKEKRKEKELMRENEGSVPKLTLKLGSQSPCTDSQETKKLNIKPVVKKEEVPQEAEEKVEAGPELAKISALVTGQPKKVTLPTTSTDNFPTSSTDSFHNQPKKSMFKPIPKIRPIKVRKDSTEMDTNTSLGTPPSKYVDADGNEVWICPACGIQDDGSPMIGCDDCDAWYHWVCVGIQIAPHDNEDWYCRHCIVKKQEVLQTDKKKKRKKKEKKNILPN